MELLLLKRIFGFLAVTKELRVEIDENVSKSLKNFAKSITKHNKNEMP